MLPNCPAQYAVWLSTQSRCEQARVTTAAVPELATLAWSSLIVRQHLQLAQRRGQNGGAMVVVTAEPNLLLLLLSATLLPWLSQAALPAVTAAPALCQTFAADTPPLAVQAANGHRLSNSLPISKGYYAGGQWMI